MIRPRCRYSKYTHRLSRTRGDDPNLVAAACFLSSYCFGFGHLFFRFSAWGAPSGERGVKSADLELAKHPKLFPTAPTERKTHCRQRVDALRTSLGSMSVVT